MPVHRVGKVVARGTQDDEIDPARAAESWAMHWRSQNQVDKLTLCMGGCKTLRARELLGAPHTAIMDAPVG